MQTIKIVTKTISPNAVITQHGGNYEVPAEMIMEKAALVAAVPVTNRLNIMVIAPYIINDMKMLSSVKSTSMAMPEITGFGDMSLIGLYNIYSDAPIRPEQRLTGGLGLQIPTGANNVKIAGSYVHAMMQPGTGSWDPLISLNYMRAFYPLVLQINLSYL
ncbi:MAG: hypothetical protein HQK93_04885, partial [Nitrospirae bacterium]|nr:hypothetical protein [Nitrospirota bacterium]